MSVPAARTLWKPVAIAAAIVFVYAKVMAHLGYDWWTDENYSHGLLIPLIIGYILWASRESLSRARRAPSLAWGGATVLFALAALWAGTAGAELYMQRLSLVLMLAGVVIYFWGFRLLKLLLLPFSLLLLAIPIPTIVFNKIAFPLQLFASQCAVWMMRALNISVLRYGNVIELMPLGAKETKKLEVAEACSGIRSLMTLVTLAVVFAYLTHPKDKGDDKDNGAGGGRFTFLRRYSFWRATLLVGAAVPIAILTNAVRVSGTGILARYYGMEVADGFFHTFSGWVMYIIAFLLLLGVGSLLDRINRIAQRKGENKGATDSSIEETVAARASARTSAREKASSSIDALPVKGAGAD